VSYTVLTSKERKELVETFFLLKGMGEHNSTAKMEAMTALRCLKAVHSNAIEDKRVDRIFLQVLLHNAGVPDKLLISRHYLNASNELRGQEKMLRWLEDKAVEREEFSADGQIAAIAKVNDLIIVTANISDYEMFSDIVIENWHESFSSEFSFGNEVRQIGKIKS
jgi:hypothetical protein